MKGFINLIKPQGMSSAYAVGAVKKRFNLPCGHMGTLDPMASGVLPVGLGKASRLFQYLLDKEKVYIARFKFGVSTDTLDTTGNQLQTSSVIPSLEEINSILPSFVGEIDQVPPKYSAKCVDGKRGYELARKGIDFTLAPKKVCILSAKCLGQVSNDEFDFEFHCKGGTYIRSLARDIAIKCDTLGVMSRLDRQACGIFNYKNGVTVEQVKSGENLENYIIPADQAVSFDKIILQKKQAEKILNGVFENYGFADGVYRVYNQDEFWGVGEAQGGVLRIKAYVR